MARTGSGLQSGAMTSGAGSGSGVDKGQFVQVIKSPDTISHHVLRVTEQRYGARLG